MVMGANGSQCCNENQLDAGLGAMVQSDAIVFA